jgi:hypothetical protein
MEKARLWLVLALVILIAAGCGEDAEPTPDTEFLVPTRGPTATSSVRILTATPFVPSPLPPTWTPAATDTPAPDRGTIAYTYERPTATDILYPTYTPSPVPPTPTPAGPLVTLTADAINWALDQALERGSGGFYLEPPQVELMNGLALVSVDVLTTPGDASTARAATLQFTLLVEDGRLVLKKLRTFFDDDNAVFEDELVDNILTTVEEIATDLLFEQVAGDDARFSVADVTIAPGGIAVQTVLIP